MFSWSDLNIDVRNRVSGEIKTTCPKCSQQRKKKSYRCLNVNLDQGVYNCWHCGWNGSIRKGKYVRPQVAPKEYRKPDFHAKLLDDKSLEILMKRGITPEVAARNQISLATHYMPQREAEVECLAFPFMKDGSVVNVKYKDKIKNFTQESGAEKVWYKFDDIDPDCTIITEGEFDALALEVAGYRHTISVPDGAPVPNAKNLEGKFTYIDAEHPKIVEVKKFILAVDNDAPGKKLEEELARRLGKDRCWRVEFPEGCKDANDVLMKIGVEALDSCIRNAKPYPVDGIFQIEDFNGEIESIFRDGLPQGVSTGWENLDEFYRPSEGQWTLVTGVPGMGKSEWLDALAMNMSRINNWIIGVCSPENQPISYHATKLMEKYMGKRMNKMTEDEFNEAREWVNFFFKFVLPEDRTLDSLLEKAKLLVVRYGMKGIIIDPYNEIIHTNRQEGVSETEYVSEFLAKIRAFARNFNVHVWLVAHPTKLQKGMDGKYPVPTGYDIAGSAHFFNKADNIIAVHRDKSDRHSLSEIHVQKIRSRWLGQLGMTRLEWDASSGRYSVADEVGAFLR